jgi:hypothetical protein
LGEPVYASAAGRVVTVLNNCGNYVDVVIIEHHVAGIEEAVYSFYGHMEADGYVQEGDWVDKRQQLGILGDPVSFGPHLHFEIKNRTALVNPPFSSCSDTQNGVYISAGYSGLSDDYDGGDYYDPTDSVAGNRYYHPSRFIENHKDEVPTDDCAEFEADLNYPDGTEVSPGETIRKGWQLSNCGDTTWRAADGYRAVRVSGDYGPGSFSIPTVGPGQNGDLYADITVPDMPGTYRATYKLEGPWGIFGTEFWVEVEVQEIQDPCKAEVPSDRWNGEYFKNMNLGGNPVMIRDDGEGFLDFDWGSGSPGTDCGVPADRFSVRLTRSIYFAAGTYRFTVVSDDGFRLYLDGDLALEKWFDQSPTTYIVDVSLSEGNHTVVLEYYENQGGAVAKLSWDAYEPGADNIWLEAEWGQLNQPMRVVQDPSSASGAYIWIPNNGGTGGSALYHFSVPQAGNYVIWGRVLAVKGQDDSFYISVDSGSDALWDTQMATAWAWDRVSHRNGADPLTYYLQAGSHTLSIKQREDGTKIDKILITADMGYIPQGMGSNQTPGWCLTAVAQDRWQGEYFDNVNLDGQPAMVRDDGDGFLNFNWGAGSPGMQCGVAADRFSARWTRQIYFNLGTYRFTVTADDGVRLYVDGHLELSEWFDQAPTTYTVEVSLSAGTHAVTLEYYENGGGAVAQLAWTEVAN